jgi:SAM-dependent methyltransferase
METEPLSTKFAVKEFWDRASCGEDLYLHGEARESYRAQADSRYRLEPYIEGFAGFDGTRGKRVLEIGVGLGADHQRFAEAGADLHGVDLTPRAIEHTTRRLSLFGLRSSLAVGDAENLPFPAGQFDLVYSWGVLHHTPDTPRAFQEVLRVLKPGGQARIMIYNTWSMVGLMLWVRYGLLRLRPWMTLREVYDRHLESPGTKAYTRSGAMALMKGFERVRIRTVLTHGDLLTSEAGQRHRGAALSIAKAIWPRWLIRRMLPGAGLFMLIEGTKPAAATRG